MDEVPFGPKFIADAVKRTPQFKQKLSKIVNVIGKMMFGGYAAVTILPTCAAPSQLVMDVAG